MKHGDQAKAKSAKAVSKASGKESSSKAVRPTKSEGKSSKAVAPSKSSGKNETGAKRADKKGAAANLPKAVRSEAPGGFTNPAVGTSYRSAIEKYANAFRRLTD